MEAGPSEKTLLVLNIMIILFLILTLQYCIKMQNEKKTYKCLRFYCETCKITLKNLYDLHIVIIYESTQILWRE